MRMCKRPKKANYIGTDRSSNRGGLRRVNLIEQHYSAQASYFAAFRGIRDTKIEKSRGIQDKKSL